LDTIPNKAEKQSVSTQTLLAMRKLVAFLKVMALKPSL
jgi:hypothetical protein